MAVASGAPPTLPSNTRFRFLMLAWSLFMFVPTQSKRGIDGSPDSASTTVTVWPPPSNMPSKARLGALLALKLVSSSLVSIVMSSVRTKVLP